MLSLAKEKKKRFCSLHKQELILTNNENQALLVDWVQILNKNLNDEISGFIEKLETLDISTHAILEICLVATASIFGDALAHHEYHNPDSGTRDKMYQLINLCKKETLKKIKIHSESKD